MPLPHRITVEPDPPQAGQPLRICYDFSGSGLESTTLRVTFDPGGSEDYAVTPANPCVTINVPGNAETYNITDLASQSQDKGGPVDS